LIGRDRPVSSFHLFSRIFHFLKNLVVIWARRSTASIHVFRVFGSGSIAEDILIKNPDTPSKPTDLNLQSLNLVFLTPPLLQKIRPESSTVLFDYFVFKLNRAKILVRMSSQVLIIPNSLVHLSLACIIPTNIFLSLEHLSLWFSSKVRSSS